MTLQEQAETINRARHTLECMPQWGSSAQDSVTLFVQQSHAELTALLAWYAAQGVDLAAVAMAL